jgi:hypothetical protein
LLPTPTNISSIYLPKDHLLQLITVQQWVQTEEAIALPLLYGTFVLVPPSASSSAVTSAQRQRAKLCPESSFRPLTTAIASAQAQANCNASGNKVKPCSTATPVTSAQLQAAHSTSSSKLAPAAASKQVVHGHNGCSSNSAPSPSAAAMAAAVSWRLRQVSCVEVCPGVDPADATVVLVGGERVRAGAVCAWELADVPDQEVGW